MMKETQVCDNSSDWCISVDSQGGGDDNNDDDDIYGYGFTAQSPPRGLGRQV